MQVDKATIDKIKKETEICNTFSCYDNCEQCVNKYLDWNNKQPIPNDCPIKIGE